MMVQSRFRQSILLWSSRQFASYWPGEYYQLYPHLRSILLPTNNEILMIDTGTGYRGPSDGYLFIPCVGADIIGRRRRRWAELGVAETGLDKSLSPEELRPKWKTSIM